MMQITDKGKRCTVTLVTEGEFWFGFCIFMGQLTQQGI